MKWTLNFLQVHDMVFGVNMMENFIWSFVDSCKENVSTLLLSIRQCKYIAIMDK